MSTTIRPSVSPKNKYWIDRHRYYELKHFCLQYPIWYKKYQSTNGMISLPATDTIFVESSEVSDPTSKAAIEKAFYAERIRMIHRAAFDADSQLFTFIIRAVTEDLSFTFLKTRLDIPCSRDTYYDRYRKFFWILSKMRQ